MPLAKTYWNEMSQIKCIPPKARVLRFVCSVTIFFAAGDHRQCDASQRWRCVAAMQPRIANALLQRTALRMGRATAC